MMHKHPRNDPTSAQVEVDQEKTLAEYIERKYAAMYPNGRPVKEQAPGVEAIDDQMEFEAWARRWSPVDSGGDDGQAWAAWKAGRAALRSSARKSADEGQKDPAVAVSGEAKRAAASQEKPRPEPVAWGSFFPSGKIAQATACPSAADGWRRANGDVRPLYTEAEPVAQKKLTFDEWFNLSVQSGSCSEQDKDLCRVCWKFAQENK